MGGWDKAAEYGDSSGWRGTLIGLVGVIAMVAVIVATTVAAGAQQTSIDGVASVIDGDTLEIHGQRIRLSGIDAPERGKRCDGVNVSQRSAQALDDLVEGRTLHCTVSGVDRYDRSIAVCLVGQTDVAAVQVAQGWARDWPRYSGGEYGDEEAAAREARRGVWASECLGLWGERDYSATAR
ncbi:nuclease [alpha proteobacterium U9-1i]|nr:nuclease [alpha proteobacterium U9-1i]